MEALAPEEVLEEEVVLPEQAYRVVTVLEET